MASDMQVKETDEHQTVVGQERPAVEEPPATIEGTREQGDETTPSGVPTASPPMPPNGRLAASIQRMPLAWRWVLGLALAFLSGFVIVTLGNISPTATAFAGVIMVVLALAAGFVLGSWWSLLALAIASAVGAGIGSWVTVQMSPPGAFEGTTGMSAVLLVFFFYALGVQVPLILFLLAGTGIGKLQGITLGKPHALSTREASVSRWISALSLAITGGFVTLLFNSNIPGLITQTGSVLEYLTVILFAFVFAVTCLLAGWLLRSWWGCVVVSIAYVCGSALLIMNFARVSFSIMVVWFVLYSILPAVVMSVIGTVIGKHRDRLREQA